MRRAILVTLCLLSFDMATVNADVPSRLTIQGRITDSIGIPLPAGIKSLGFRIYSAAVGGAQLWPQGAGLSEVQLIATDAEGLWTAEVGADFGLNDAVFASIESWLEVTVDGTVLPRVRLLTAPYAFRVGTIDGAIGGTLATKVTIGTNHQNSGAEAFVAGNDNKVLGNYSTIPGGLENRATGNTSVVSGGYRDSATAQFATVSGGGGNWAGAHGSTVGGGQENRSTGLWATVAGGGGFPSGNSATGEGAAIGGGGNNIARGNYSVIAGGGGATAGDSNSAAGQRSSVLGGLRNSATAEFSAIVGGQSHEATGGGSFIGGGLANRTTSFDAVIGGGQSNVVHGLRAAILGGLRDSADGDYSTIGGGYYNYALGDYASITGGANNRARGAYSAISGGGGDNPSDSNSAMGFAAAIPGGQRNVAGGSFSFAAGLRAQATHDGSFVWGDSTNADVASDRPNQFKIRASNGMRLAVNAGSAKVIAIGDYYRDNSVVSWGNVGATGTLESEFGVTSVVKGVAGLYTINLDVTSTNSSALVMVVSPEIDGLPSSAATARIAAVDQVDQNTFNVYITNGSWDGVDSEFTFIVMAR